MTLDAKTILTVAGAAFGIVGIYRWRKVGRLGPGPRTWLLIGAIFLIVSQGLIR